MPRAKVILDRETGRLARAVRVRCPVCHGRQTGERCPECRGRGEVWSTAGGGTTMRKYGKVGISEKRARK